MVMMPSYDTLLLVPMAMQAGLLAMLARADRTVTPAEDADTARWYVHLVQRHFALAIVFLLACGVALWWRATDETVLAFASMFVMAQAVQVALALTRPELGWSELAMRASAVALLGLVTVLALGTVPPDAEQMVPR